MRRRRWALWTVGILVVLVLLAVIGSFFIDEPLRRSMERDVNRRLQGYTATIGKLDFHPIGFSLDLEDVTIVQDENPDPPVAHLRKLTASVEWRALLFGRVVADFRFDQPKLYVNRQHLVKEAMDEVAIDKKGWQEALAAVYPLKIDTFRVVDAEITYVDTAGDRSLGRPITISRLNIDAGNIRNVLSADHVYPSTVRAEAVVFDRGRLTLDGHADFLAVPHPGVNAKLALEDIDLGTFEPILKQFNVALRKGVLSGRGLVEYAPHTKTVHLEDVRLTGFDGDLIHARATADTQKKAAKAAGSAAEQASNHPDMLLRVDRVIVRDATFGFVNRAAKKPYRVFLTNTNIDITNLSNQRSEGTSNVKLTGKFMGTGETTVDGKFRAQDVGPELHASIRIESTDMRAMNDLLGAYGNIDVAAGQFSAYSEIDVKDRKIRGYVKPLFSSLDVYDKEQDRDKPAMKKLYEKTIEGVSKLLKNRQRREVATRAEIVGSIDDPKASVLQVVGRLIENAFFKAILPGFESVVRGRRSDDDSAAASPRGR
jgi:hypothetical protein